MSYVNRILTVVFDAVYAALSWAPHWLTLILLSVGVGVLALLVVRYCSNQSAIGRVKDDIKANMLALKLFKDELPVVFRAQGRLIFSALRIQYYMLPPLLVMFIPFVLIAAQMGLRYQWRPVLPDEEAILTVALRDDATDAAMDMTIEAPAAVRVSPPGHGVRQYADKKQIDWTVRASAPGTYALTFRWQDQTATKRLSVGADRDRVSPVRPGPGFLERVLYPAERPFPADSVVQSISIDYPLRDSWFHGADWWILWFLVLSIVAALILKPVLRVKF